MKTIKQLKNVFTTIRSISSSNSNSAPATAQTIHDQFANVSSPSPSFSSFYMKDLETIEATKTQLQPKPVTTDNIKFGHLFSDHMLEVDWSDESGWTRPLISPLHNFSLHPGAKVLHYAIELFEGMKAYRGVDGVVRLFRPDMNMARMRRTALRSDLPDFSAEELIKIVCHLVKVDKEWVPYSNTSSLYIRPTLIGTDPTLGVAHSHQAKLFVLTGPVGAYYPTGFQPISLLADTSFVRAFPGGVGGYKMGCNYAPTIFLGRRATELGCQQVLWLYDKDEKLTEVGTMNIFVYWRNEDGEDELVTPPLNDGLILPGITRDSILEIAQEWKEFKISERYPTMEEVRKAISEKRIYQIFGAGTACVVSPVGKILYRNPGNNQYEELHIPTMTSEKQLMQRFYDTVMDIQYGRTDFKSEWCRSIDE